MREPFADLLRMFRERNGRTRNGLAHDVGVDPSYLTRIEHGDREPPRQHIVDALARSLRLSIPERNQFMLSAGYAPTSLVSGWDEALQSVADVLNNLQLTPEERAEFRTVVRLISDRWTPAPVPDPWSSRPLPRWIQST